MLRAAATLLSKQPLHIWVNKHHHRSWVHACLHENQTSSMIRGTYVPTSSCVRLHLHHLSLTSLLDNSCLVNSIGYCKLTLCHPLPTRHAHTCLSCSYIFYVFIFWSPFHLKTHQASSLHIREYVLLDFHARSPVYPGMQELMVLINSLHVMTLQIQYL